MTLPLRFPVVLPVMVLCLLVLVGCGTQEKKKPVAVAPLPTYTGPAYLHNTVGSVASLRGFDQLPVSGYGFVIGLDGTGSAEVPAYLRQWIINTMRRYGVGSARQGLAGITPERLIASNDTTVVRIDGLIPPGAVKGTRFDLLVTAIDTQSTSLQGGKLLYPPELGIDGANEEMRFTRTLAKADGYLYVDPLGTEGPQTRRIELQRQAVILSGGMAVDDRVIELVLNQPSWQRSRLIADRINERFPGAPGDKADTAEPKTDQIIRINIPKRFVGRADELLALISRLFLQRSPGFEAQKALSLAQTLRLEPQLTDDISQTWVALGKTTLPVLRKLYRDEDLLVRLAALEAGARLEDEQTTDALIPLAKTGDAATRRRVAQMLVNLPRSIRGASALQGLLDDPDADVRIAAYESLSRNSDPMIQRLPIGQKSDFKFMLDLVPSQRPLIYISQVGFPKIVIFDPGTAFKPSMLSQTWDNHLMVRTGAPGQPTTVFYQPFGQPNAMTQDIAPYVANFVRLLAHQTTEFEATPGFDLSYSRVVSALHSLWTKGAIDGELTLQENELPAAIRRVQEMAPQQRPETIEGETPPSIPTGPTAPNAPNGPTAPNAPNGATAPPAPPAPATTNKAN